MGDWARDDLPDLLWPALYLADRWSSDLNAFVRWQEAVQRDLAGLASPKVLGENLDGVERRLV